MCVEKTANMARLRKFDTTICTVAESTDDMGLGRYGVTVSRTIGTALRLYNRYSESKIFMNMPLSK